jgi:alpha-ribazole phosphatase
LKNQEEPNCQKLLGFLNSLQTELEPEKYLFLLGDIFDVWAQNYAERAPPNGETFSQLQQRGIAFLNDVLSQHANGHVVVVTHGGMIRALLAHVLNMQLKGLFRFNVDYGSITQLDFSAVQAGGVPKIDYVNR